MQRPAYFLLTVSLVMPLVVLAQELPFKHYTSSNEINPLPSGAVTAVYQDRSGYLWLASFSGGLVRYDGQRMDVYSDKDGILNSGIWSLIQDRSGRLWVIMREGVRVSEKPLQRYVAGERVRFVAAVRSDSRAQPLLRAATYGATVDTRGHVWILTEAGGLLRYVPTKGGGLAVDSIDIHVGPGGTRHTIYAVGARRNGDVWALTENREIVVFTGGGQQYTVLPSGAPGSAIDVLYEGPSGTLWAGGNDGTVWRLAGARFEQVLQLNGNIKALLQDPSGILWVGGTGTGLARYDPATRSSTVFARANGLLDEYVWSLIRDREGSLWIGHMTGLSKLRANYEAYTRYTARSYAGEQPALPGADAQVVVPGVPVTGIDRALFVGTNDGIAIIRADGQSAHLSATDGLPHNAVLSACLDENRHLWVGTFWGLTRIDFGSKGPLLPSAFSTHTATVFGEPAYLHSLSSAGFTNYSCSLNFIPEVEGSKTRVPFLCFGGVAFMNCKLEEEWFTFDQRAGVPRRQAIYMVQVDSAGYVYVGMSHEGLFRSVRPLTRGGLHAMKLEPGSVTKAIIEPFFERVRGFPAVTASSGVWQGRDSWVSTDSGIVVLEGTPLHAKARIRLFGGRGVTSLTRTPSGSIWAAVVRIGLVEIDPVRQRAVRVVRRDDGLLDDQAVAYPSVTADAANTIYFGTSSGLSLYRPAYDRTNTVPPLLGFGDVRFRESADGRNELDVRYRALSFTNEKQVRYRTRLVGNDDDWSVATATPDIRYTNLNAILFPRSYTFEVLAANDDGVWSTTPLRYTFNVQPALWLRWWAVVIYALVLGSGVFGMDRFQRRKVIRQERDRAAVREKELRAEAAEARAGQLQAENDRKSQELESARTLQLSMLPATIPEHPFVELAAYMRTATEVGGDYYDFHVGEDGTLTFVVGDATGHGLAAGTMVTAMKGLFTDHAEEPELTIVLQRAARALRRMRMPKLYMALAIGRLRGSMLELAGAGLPPALIFRNATDAIELVPLKGMPLGSPGVFPYRSTMVELLPGDTVLLMSDGFPELRGASGEMLGYDESVAVFADGAGRTADQLIAYLKEHITLWCGGVAPDDDITFVALRAKLPVETRHAGVGSRVEEGGVFVRA